MRILVTGGLGFIAEHLSNRFVGRGDSVTLLDSFSRPGCALRLERLRSAPRETRPRVVRADVRVDLEEIDRAVAAADVVVHLAGQVSLAASIADPRRDFEVNLAGTFNVVEAVRRARTRPLLLFASTNKVYGPLSGRRIESRATRDVMPDLPHGVSEDEPLDFQSPYGCSKGGADSYVRDAARIHGLRTVVFRLSCVYGEHQYGYEDQGFLAHFAASALRNETIRIRGTGLQVRDLLHVGDLVAAVEAAIERADAVVGRVFNVGGGPANSASLIEILHALERRLGRRVAREHLPPRAGDVAVYVSDIRRARLALSFEPRVGVEEGIDRVVSWLERDLDAIRERVVEAPISTPAPGPKA